jgi:hypothetical protein
MRPRFTRTRQTRRWGARIPVHPCVRSARVASAISPKLVCLHAHEPRYSCGLGSHVCLGILRGLQVDPTKVFDRVLLELPVIFVRLEPDCSHAELDVG